VVVRILVESKQPNKKYTKDGKRDGKPTHFFHPIYESFYQYFHFFNLIVQRYDLQIHPSDTGRV
jgi:hypothetical protein